MESSSDYALIDELRAMRPAPSPTFAAELDERAAAGFPRPSRVRRVSDWVNRARALPRRRMLLPAGGVALAAVAVATAIALSGHGTNPGPAPESGAGVLSDVEPFKATEEVELVAGNASHAARHGGSHSADGALPASATVEVDHASSFTPFSQHLNAAHRLVRRDAELLLAASPGNVESDASQVFSTVHRFNGIVMSSNITEGLHAGASFSLLIPSAKVSDALDSLSQIDQVRSREESTADVTAPAVSLAGRVKESEARLESLLSQLAGANTESERQVVEAELRSTRRQATAQRARLAQLHRHVHFSRVEVGIKPARDAATSGSWGVGDGLHDAGHVLSAAAGVILIALVVLGPIALIALLAWLARRAWLARARHRALG